MNSATMSVNHWAKEMRRLIDVGPIINSECINPEWHELPRRAAR